MATGHPLYGTGSQTGGLDLNGWCSNDPGDTGSLPLVRDGARPVAPV
jgi:hypothetical protein